MIDDDLLSFNYDHGLDLGPESCMCNFGMSYVCDVGHTGHVTLARRVLPHLPRTAWPLIHWDEQEQHGVTFAVSDGRWLSGWLARFADWDPDALVEERDAVVAAAGDDEAVAPVIDAILAGERDPGALYAIAAPGSLLARTFALAARQDLTDRLRPYGRRSGEPPRGEASEWEPLIDKHPLYNAPAAFAATFGTTTPRAWDWLQRNLKYDTGGGVCLNERTCAAARHLLAHDRDPNSPYLPILLGFEDADDISGAPFCAAGRALLDRGQPLDAITAFENAILFERCWSEAFHMDAFEGIQQAARALGAPDFLAYLETMGAD